MCVYINPHIYIPLYTMCICMYVCITHTHTPMHMIFTYYKESAYTITEAHEFKNCGMDQWAGNPGKPMVQVKSKGNLTVFWSTIQKASQKLWSFCSIQAFHWLDEAHPHYGQQSTYSKFTNLNVNLIQKHPPSWFIKLTITHNNCVHYCLIFFPLVIVASTSALFSSR